MHGDHGQGRFLQLHWLDNNFQFRARLEFPLAHFGEEILSDFQETALQEKQSNSMRMDSQDLTAISNPVLQLSRSLRFGGKATRTNL